MNSSCASYMRLSACGRLLNEHHLHLNNGLSTSWCCGFSDLTSHLCPCDYRLIPLSARVSQTPESACGDLYQRHPSRSKLELEFSGSNLSTGRILSGAVQIQDFQGVHRIPPFSQLHSDQFSLCSRSCDRTV